MTEGPVLLEVSDRIATVTLNRPAARNALSSEVLQLLPELLREADGREDVDVVILTGADPAFCAGLDLKELGSSGGNLGAGSDHPGSVPADGEAGDRSDQRPRDHRRFRARAQLRLPRRIRTSPLRRHAHASRRDARLGAHGAAPSGDRRATRPGDELHWQLPRRARGLPVGPRQPCREARRAVAVHPRARRPISSATTSVASARSARRTTRSASGTVGDGWDVERHDSRDWQRNAGFDPAEIERRRMAIVDRGRAQT